VTAYVIGLTGQIGSGKSTVAKMLKVLGATVLDADDVTRDVMRPGQPAFSRIHETFGREVLDDEDGTIDRVKLGQKVFGDPRSLRRLEQIVWPHVIARVLDVRAGLFDDSILVVEAVKLLDTPLARACDELWVTTAPRDALLARVVARGLSEVEVRLRLGAQMSEADYTRDASVVLDNAGDENELRRQVEAAWRRSEARAKKRVTG